MLHYIDVHLITVEVPDEISLCIYLSGCVNRCMSCHSPELLRTDFGYILSDYFSDLVELYVKRMTCICFLGEGSGLKNDRDELIGHSKYSHTKGLKTCLYSGRNTSIEDWMSTFDYVKTGAFDVERGALQKRATNQIFYKKDGRSYRNITSKFWLASHETN